MDYKVIPNFLPKEVYESIFNSIFEKPTPLPLFYQANIAHKEDTSGFFFGNLLFTNNSIEAPFHYYKIVLPLLHYIRPEYVFRAQVNCFIKQPKPIFSSPHIDNDNPHKVLLYSINTNNGYTVLDPNGRNIKIPSIANQALLFDGLIYHQAVTQTDENIRINVNINYN